jgi:mannose-6-phosphate isomerase-like protein (cupin superfamily)
LCFTHSTTRIKGSAFACFIRILLLSVIKLFLFLKLSEIFKRPVSKLKYVNKKITSKKEYNFKAVCCFFWGYNSQNENMSFVRAYIDGRFTNNGRVANTDCEEIYFVLDGSEIIHPEFNDFNVEKDDLYHFKKGEKCWLEGKQLETIFG